VEKEYLSYLAHILETSVKTPMITSIPLVSEFLEVFPTELPDLPPDHDSDFCIDLEIDTQPISILLYRMARPN